MNFKTVVYGDVTVLNLIAAAGIVLLAAIVAKAVDLYLRRALKDGTNQDQLRTFNKLILYIIVSVAAVAVLGQVGVNLSGLFVAGGIVGVVIGFASQSIVGNLVSGVFLIFERPVKIGDQVSIDGVSGFVEDIQIISTLMRTYDGLYVRIPNEKVFTTTISNFVANPVRRFEYAVGIRYSDDAYKALSIIKKLIDDHPYALKEPEPQAFVDSLGDNSVNIVVRIWGPATDWYGIKMDLLWKIKCELEAQGIEIPFPQRVFWQGGKEVESPPKKGADNPAPEAIEKTPQILDQI